MTQIDEINRHIASRTLTGSIYSPKEKPRYYRGIGIIAIPRNRSGFCWQAYCVDRFLYADTLAGIKRLISENLKGQE